MRIRIPTRISTLEAIALQERLAPLVSETSGLPSHLTRLVGCDATYFDGKTLAAATLVDYSDLHLLKVKLAMERTRFPYVPGLLAFREAPVVLRAVRALDAKSFVCLVDAHGLAHPRRFGLACFVGVALDRPTIGVAKSLLFGSVEGDRVVDEEGKQIAERIPLPDSKKAIYVSVGHKVSLKDAVEIVRRCLTMQGLAPIRMAHEQVTKRRWEIKKSNPAFS
jgi:deoxyribonuclease V